jgi:hypothetical protein
MIVHAYAPTAVSQQNACAVLETIRQLAADELRKIFEVIAK